MTEGESPTFTAGSRAHAFHVRYGETRCDQPKCFEGRQIATDLVVVDARAFLDVPVASRPAASADSKLPQPRSASRTPAGTVRMKRPSSRVRRLAMMPRPNALAIDS